MSLKIYFCGSIRGGRQDGDLYAKLIKQLQSYGTVLTEHVGDKNVLTDSEKGTMSEKDIHDRDVAWLTECDAVVAEVTQVSLGVGYEIGRAVAMNKKILCLYRPQPDKRLSAMIAGAYDDSFSVHNYKEEEAAGIFKDFFAKISS
ncbi:5-hydroxymethyl-dUMP N-hydrolase-like [Amphiura filiformis]|uniref:5-hydroxymethyl-dUMP N-hydrolase-like n=1 Tax=Amphiura filiformis TaxID=82378 RepID=UPI003B226259